MELSGSLARLTVVPQAAERDRVPEALNRRDTVLKIPSRGSP